MLRDEGYDTILINSNPATIMTDPGWADRTYIEPLDLDGIARCCERERPDALLPTLGGQTALNAAHRSCTRPGVLDELGIELIGASIQRHRDGRGPRAASPRRWPGAACAVPARVIVHSVAEAEAARRLGTLPLPLVIRPAFTLGGQGGGFADTPRSCATHVARGVAESPIGQVLLEESLLGWGEFELEVIRDRLDNVVIVCSIENLDPMGVHTGDSVCVAPAHDAVRPRVPGAARRGGHRDPRRRRRDRRLERAVRASTARPARSS